VTLRTLVRTHSPFTRQQLPERINWPLQGMSSFLIGLFLPLRFTGVLCGGHDDIDTL